MTLEARVADHYGTAGLETRILEALTAAGKDVDALTVEDLAQVDEFHVRGRVATAELGDALGLTADMAVVDVGSGVGGPSRHLATAHDCRITGIDLTAAYCQAATMLAARVGLSDRVEYRQGSALNMPFAAGDFDAGYTQHVAMNIEDKEGLYREIARVLKPGARFGIYDLLQGQGGEVLLPAPWARTAANSFLATPDEMRAHLEAAGFEIVGWRDTSAAGRAWFQELRRNMAAQGSKPMTFQVLLGTDFELMAANQVRNLMEDRVAPTEIICRKPELEA